MTKNDSIAKAGRELDALVAERIMGWTRIPDGHCDECRSMEEAIFSTENGYGVAPHYSTSIADAWEVVEKMESKGWKVTVAVTDRHVCIQRTYDPLDENSFHAEEETIPHAICLAALKAIRR